MFRMFTECYCDHVGMPVDFSNDVLGTLAPPRRSQIPMVRGILEQAVVAHGGTVFWSGWSEGWQGGLEG